MLLTINVVIAFGFDGFAMDRSARAAFIWVPVVGHEPEHCGECNHCINPFHQLAALSVVERLWCGIPQTFGRYPSASPRIAAGKHCGRSMPKRPRRGGRRGHQTSWGVLPEVGFGVWGERTIYVCRQGGRLRQINHDRRIRRNLFSIGSQADFPTAERAKWAGLLAYSAH
jgi:hypothetical protein